MKHILLFLLATASCKNNQQNEIEKKGTYAGGLEFKLALVEEQVQLFSTTLSTYKLNHGAYPGSLTAIAELEADGFASTLQIMIDPFFPENSPLNSYAGSYPKIYSYINLEEMAATACLITDECDTAGYDLAALQQMGYLVISRGPDFDFEFDDPSLNWTDNADQLFFNIMSYIIRTIHDPTVFYNSGQQNGDIIYSKNGILF